MLIFPFEFVELLHVHKPYVDGIGIWRLKVWKGFGSTKGEQALDDKCVLKHEGLL